MKVLNNNLVQLVNLLNDGAYHDGTSIGEQLGISRAAVWKLIKKLQAYEVPLICTKGKGYCLTTPLTLLDSQQINSALNQQSVSLHLLEKTPSTNDYVKKLPADPRQIIACLAETQTAGKGRLGRQWHSPFAENIYLSLRYPFNQDISELNGLSLVVALTLCHSLESQLQLPHNTLRVKWPNDILLNQHKLAGILLEIEAESNGFCQLIIGIGVNVNMRQNHSIDQDWTSLAQFTTQYIDRNILVPTIINTLIDAIAEFRQVGLTGFKKAWQQRDILTQKSITMHSANKIIKGLCLGINAQGHLKLQLESGQTITLSSGDASLNGKNTG